MEFLSSPHFSEEELADMHLAVGEACMNAFKHGSPRGESDEIRVTCRKSELMLVVEISDDGNGFDPDSIPTPTPGSMPETGAGLLLIRALVDAVEYSFDAGTTVRLTKRCRRDTPAIRTKKQGRTESKLPPCISTDA